MAVIPPKSDKPHHAAARMAARQHGVVTRAQLEAAGVGRRAVSEWTAVGTLHRLYRGVYAVGHRGVSVEGRWLAAVLALGDGAALSHRSAAGLWGLMRRTAAPVHVAVPGTSGRKTRPGIRIHRSTTLSPEVVVVRNRIPVTSAARTLADLRREAEPAEMRRAIRQAESLGYVTGLERGVPTASELEDRLLALVRQSHLPEPEVNVRLHGHLVDFLWRDARLVVETDGYAFHRGRTAFESDRARDLDLRAAGYQVLRFTWAQVTGQAERVIASLHPHLHSSGPPGHPDPPAGPHLPADLDGPA